MKPSKRSLRVLQSKIQHMGTKNGGAGCYWYIEGTPTEILILVDHYGVTHDQHPFHIKWIRNHKIQGESSPMIFRFHASTKSLTKLFGDKRHESK